MIIASRGAEVTVCFDEYNAFKRKSKNKVHIDSTEHSKTLLMIAVHDDNKTMLNGVMNVTIVTIKPIKIPYKLLFIKLHYIEFHLNLRICNFRSSLIQMHLSEQNIHLNMHVSKIHIYRMLFLSHFWTRRTVFSKVVDSIKKKKVLPTILYAHSTFEKWVNKHVRPFTSQK